jgi:phospholipase C
MIHRQGVIVALATFGLTSCVGRSATSMMPAAYRQSGATEAHAFGDLAHAELPTPIKHVVIIVQENRSTDYLFQGIHGADIATYGVDYAGQRVPLRPISLTAPYDLQHGHSSFFRDYNDGKMNGFDAGMSGEKHLRPFGYAPESEVQPYHDMARQYVLGDHMFQTNRGPSFPAHLYLVSGTAGDSTMAGYRVEGNAFDAKTQQSRPGGCASPLYIRVDVVSIKNGAEGKSHRPCFDHAVLSDFLDAKGITWRYYQQGKGPGRWHALDAMEHVRWGKDFQYVIPSSAQVLSDIAAGDLAGVSWVMPAANWSDHAGKHGTDKGPAWIAAIVNAIGKSHYWDSTAILVIWDDWGGWYDHVAPPTRNYDELGFRVPLLVISPYAKKAYVSKVQHEFGSLLAFVEKAYGIPHGALKSTDWRADDLSDCFDFKQKPRQFVPIKAPPFKPLIDQYSYDEDP